MALTQRCIYLDVRRLPGAKDKGSDILSDVEFANNVWKKANIQFVVVNLSNYFGPSSTFSENGLNVLPNAQMNKVAKDVILDVPSKEFPTGASLVRVLYAGGSFKVEKGEQFFGTTFGGRQGNKALSVIFLAKNNILMGERFLWRYALAHELGHTLTVRLSQKPTEIFYVKQPKHSKTDPYHYFDSKEPQKSKQNLRYVDPEFKQGVMPIITGEQISTARKSPLLFRCETTVANTVSSSTPWLARFLR